MTEQICFHCQGHIDFAEGLQQQVEQLSYRLKKVERENYRLRHEAEEPQSKMGGKLVDDTKTFLYEWDEIRRRRFPNSRTVKLDPGGSRGRAYTAARRQWSHEDLMRMLRGVDLSEFHTSNPEFFKISSLLTQDPKKNRDERIEKHIQRTDDYDRLRGAGFTDEQARSLIHAGVDRGAHETWGSASRCPGCGRDLGREGCFCGYVAQVEQAQRAA